MSKRRFSSERAYSLTKKLVIGISFFAFVLAIINYDSDQNNKILYNWEKYCSKYPNSSMEHFDCMGIGFDQINNAREIWTKSLVVGIGLPLLFFGGIGFYRYLFPKEKE